ncbi:MAG: GNAT family N-acetyltransferase [Acidobacteriota bacterium]
MSSWTLAEPVGSERRRLLSAIPCESWPPGRDFIASHDGAAVACLRTAEADPGDGYHREHVRSLDVWWTDLAALTELAEWAVSRLESRCRLEWELPSSDEAVLAALEPLELEEEVRLVGGWRPEGGAKTEDLLLVGHAAPSRPGPEVAAPGRRARPLPPAGSWRIESSSDESRPALARFLARLAPGRAYPPGTLLSGAEQVETRRRGDLEADWLLARTDDGEVVGGLVLERPRAPERAHVRRVHLDVLPEARERGLGTALFSQAVEQLGDVEHELLEADPRSGHRPVRRALEAAGFGVAGRQRGAWRMRTPSASWDEDVVLYQYPAPSGVG